MDQLNFETVIHFKAKWGTECQFPIEFLDPLMIIVISKISDLLRLREVSSKYKTIPLHNTEK
jgi:hypothetical protein